MTLFLSKSTIYKRYIYIYKKALDSFIHSINTLHWKRSGN
ncbi:hypothetical protein HMPREF9533_03469 [Escherichia coli MS 60-1]|nr:hypothetical protein HMPREF9553_02978 [Escherichia coli MS 200-1]EGB81728.1 hypothetical protein HMPREF9533_03469 [Escherichia coli MS 60-1]